MSVRILIADDHKIMREGLREMLEKVPDIEIVAEAEDGLTAVDLVQQTSPDIVIMDVAMPHLNGIKATEQIIAGKPNTKVIVLSMYSDKRFVNGMLKVGAKGYLLKDCAFDELVRALNIVLADHIYLSPSITDAVVKNYLHQLERFDSSALTVLTAREREVVQLLTEGNTTKEIAHKLNLSVKTIETHREQVMRKLSINSIAELTKFAIREGLASLEI